MKNMFIETKLMDFEIEWEVVSINGKAGLLLKDLLKYFGYSNSSQGTIIDQVNERNRVMLSGGDVRSFKHMQKRATVIFRKGLVEFTKSKVGTTKYKIGRNLIDWFDAIAIPEIKKEWQPQEVEHIKKTTPEKEPDLFDSIKDQEMDELKRLAHLQSDRIDALEKRVKELEGKIKESMTQGIIKEDGNKNVIDVDVMMDFLRKTGVTGNVK